MIKRIFDVVASSIGLILFSPILLPTALAIWLQDFHSPLFIAKRVGKNGRLFNMIKFRSMTVNANKTGVNSTSDQDRRITRVGHIVRRLKLDEVTQLWNVLIGDMSIVGPRPQVTRHGTELYTAVEKTLLDVKPGITDLASIVFADEGQILKSSTNPDLDYNRIIRPWKSRLALLYTRNISLVLDLKIIYLTILTLIDRKKSLAGVYRIAKNLGGEPLTLEVVLRKKDLNPYPPPGADRVIEKLI